MPSDKILQKKQVFVQELREKLEKSPAGVLADYVGISVENDTKLRRELREAGVDYFVVKNTMMRLAIKDTEFSELEPVLKGSTAIALANDEDSLAPARILAKYAEGSKGKYEIKSGYMEGKVMSVDEINALAKLPGREGLLSMLLSALTGNLRNLAVGIQAVADKQAEEEGAPA